MREARERVSRSLKDVGAELGISDEGLRKIEKGRSKASNERLQHLAHIVGLRYVVHLINPDDQRAALWLRSVRFFAYAPDHFVEGITAMIDAWEREHEAATERPPDSASG